MANTTRLSPLNVQQPRDPSVSPSSSFAPEVDFNTPAVFSSNPQESQHPHLTPLTPRADAELRVLLQALPTRSDIETLVGRLEATHRKEITAVWQEVRTLTEWMGAEESSVTTLERHMTAMEALQLSQAATVLTQQL